MPMAEEIVNVISKINICFILGGRVTIKLEVHECQMVKILCQSKFNSLKKKKLLKFHIHSCMCQREKSDCFSLCLSA